MKSVMILWSQSLLQHFFSLFSGDERMKSVIKSLDVLERLLTQSKHVLFNIKPHPLNEEDLEVYLQKLQVRKL